MYLVFPVFLNVCKEEPMQDTILVFSRSNLQAGLIARTLRWREVYCLPLPFETKAEEALACHPRGIIVITEQFGENALEGFDPALLECGVPVLALEGAAGALCAHLGGSIQPALCERSAITLELTSEPLFEDIVGGERMLGGFVTMELPETLLPIATATQQVIGFRHVSMPLYAMQYPIERNDPDAAQLLENFACRVCGAQAWWTDEAIIDQAIASIRAATPEGNVLCAVSGGVDSAVCARLASLAVGDRLKCLFIDTGLLRRDEPENVISLFRESVSLTLNYVDAHEAFLRALSGVTQPHDKERIASQLMTQILIRQLTPDVRTIVMGTNFNDTLFGQSPTADLDMGDHQVRACEPVRLLFKDEVRRLASALSLPQAISGRQPFPSSGLALRVMGSVTAERLELLRSIDACFSEEIISGGHDRRLWQFYATLLDNPDHTGGYAVCLRAVQAHQGGAQSARLPFDVLERATERIREVSPQINRIVYDLTPSVHYGELE